MGTIVYNWENLRILSIMVLSILWLFIFNLPDNKEDGPEPCDNGEDECEGSSSEEEDDCFTQRDACVQVGDGRVPPLKGEGCSHTVSFFRN